MKKKNKKLTGKYASDKNGFPTDDPKIASSLMPIGDYKGFGLSLIADIFSSLLSGMPIGPDISQMYGDMSKKRYLGQFFGAIRIDAFEDPKVFKTRLSKVAEDIRSLPKDGSDTQNYLPGDPESKNFIERSERGIPLSILDKEKFDIIVENYSLDPLEYINLD